MDFKRLDTLLKDDVHTDRKNKQTLKQRFDNLRRVTDHHTEYKYPGANKKSKKKLLEKKQKTIDSVEQNRIVRRGFNMIVANQEENNETFRTLRCFRRRWNERLSQKKKRF